MDIQEYIQSGIIEQYVLGIAGADEVAELEQLRIQYPEINIAVLNFEKTIEEHLRANAVAPPAHISEALQQKLFGDQQAQILPLPQPEYSTAIKVNGTWKYLAAACVVLLIISTALKFLFLFRL
jgi:hypothetical protein